MRPQRPPELQQPRGEWRDNLWPMVPLVRYFRRLPPLIRAVSVGAVALPLTAFLLLVFWFVAHPLASFGVQAAFTRVLGIMLNLCTLGGACSYVVSTYNRRFRQPDRVPYSLSTWQSQLRVITWLAALPVGGIALALVLPPSLPLVYLLLAIAALAVSVVSTALLLAYAREQLRR